MANLCVYFIQPRADEKNGVKPVNSHIDQIHLTSYECVPLEVIAKCWEMQVCEGEQLLKASH